MIQTDDGKQIILQKAAGSAGGVAGQTCRGQIVMLVKTSRGLTMATVATQRDEFGTK